jgi:hypothetical protein
MYGESDIGATVIPRFDPTERSILVTKGDDNDDDTNYGGGRNKEGWGIFIPMP